MDLINTSLGTSYRLNKDDYFLVNFANAGSTRISLKTIPASFNRIAFTIGVDSIRNVSGAQTGALDPANGMFWTWNSGYIMAKLEGSDNVVEKVNLVFPLNATVDFQKDRSTHMTIAANANEWFGGAGQISIASTPVCTTPGTLARSVASNYLRMFEVINLVSE